MTHLTLESIARLDDGEMPTPDERAHLVNCQECREELIAFISQREALLALPRTGPPAPWDVVHARLRRAGLVSTSPERAWRHPARQLAAAALLLTAGVTAGIYMERRSGFVGLAPTTDVELPETRASGDARVAEALATVAASSREPVADTISRLAALQAIVLTTAEALKSAPADPLINAYHIAAKSQRDALVDRVTGRIQMASRWF